MLFIPTVIILAVLSWIVWFSVVYSTDLEIDSHSKFTFAFKFGIATLVVACPCAIGLAIPTAVLVGTSLGVGKGIIIKDGDVFEKASKVNTIVFDKTGTLTTGNLGL